MSTESEVREPNPGDFTESLIVAVAPSVVLAALTTAAGVSSWWGPSVARDNGLEVRFPVSDDPLVLRLSQSGNSVYWTVEECSFLPEWVGTTPTFALSTHDDGSTVIEFRHTGLTPQLDCYDKCSTDWSYFLTRRFRASLQP
ncbi:hypothetical protein [Nocardia sp. NPDC050793]|uniref:hypothetical protein n=1 Tax=Nocardia sp. NPDC050793 TaxID=3155159 RepID=UPI0033E6712E